MDKRRLNSKSVLVGSTIGLIFGAIAGALYGRVHGEGIDWVFGGAFVGVIFGQVFIGILQGLLERFVGTIREISWINLLIIPIGAIYGAILVVIVAATTEGIQAIFTGAIAGTILWAILGGIIAVIYLRNTV